MVLTKEVGNTVATADIVVDGEQDVLLAAVPVTYLLFLEKQLVNLRTFIDKLPVLDPSVAWSVDPATGDWRSSPVETVRTKKVPRNWVKAEATKEHPAQVEVYHEDVMVGTWETTRLSGALPATRKAVLSDRVSRLLTAVKYARERANSARWPTSTSPPKFSTGCSPSRVRPPGEHRGTRLSSRLKLRRGRPSSGGSNPPPGTTGRGSPIGRGSGSPFRLRLSLQSQQQRSRTVDRRSASSWENEGSIPSGPANGGSWTNGKSAQNSE